MSMTQARHRKRAAVTYPLLLGVFLASLLIVPESGAQVNPSPAALNQAAQQLGFSTSQLTQLRDQISQSGVTSNHLQQLCAGMVARHVDASAVDSIAESMGLSSDQVAKLKTCVQTGGNLPGETQRGQQGGTTAQTAQTPPSSPAVEEPPSEIERSFDTLVRPGRQAANRPTRELKQFGYSVFESEVSTFAPVDNGPVGEDYILGPGDEVRVLMWGRINQTLSLEVQRDGTVLIPNIGPLQVSGLSFSQARNLIEQRAGKITGVEVAVTMGRIRTIQVFVIGKVNHPGLYTISALSHVSNAIVAAGGISKVGSLRNIELRRSDQLVRRIDLYDMLLHGDSRGDVRLKSRDVVFVPVIGSVVGVAGDVKSPAIYELKGSESLSRVIKTAGGVGAFGYSKRLKVERIQNHQRRIVLDVSFDKLKARRFKIQDGDLIKVFPVLPKQRDVVVLKGNVYRPGVYQWRPGMRVADLIRQGEGVAERTFFDYALIRRITGRARKIQFIPVNLGKALEDGPLNVENRVLSSQDELTVYGESELQDLPTVTVSGAVRQPGTYPLTNGMKVSDLIYLAGGLKYSAYRENAQLARSEVVDGSKTRYVYSDIDLRAALTPFSPQDKLLARGDKLVVQQVSNWHKPWEVTVLGEVTRPGPYVVHEGERLASVLTKCGGLRRDAFLPATVFIRASVQELQQKRLDESRIRLKQQIARASLMPAQPGESDNSRPAALAMMQKVLEETEGRQATGRVVLHLTSLKSLPSSQSNIKLEDGDRIQVPRRPVSINVLGQVFNPTSIVYTRGLTVQDYLGRAGGPTDSADVDHIFVVKADGSIVTDEALSNSGKGRLFPLLPVVSGGIMEMRLSPGDTIFVPEKLIFVTGLQYTSEVSKIVSNAALSLATIAILGSRL